MTNAISCTTVVCAAEFIPGATCGKRQEKKTDRSDGRLREGKTEQTKMFYYARSNY